MIESIEIYFYIDTNDDFVIEYNFHREDFNLWEQILEIHKEYVEECELYKNGEKIENLEKNDEYYTLELKSKDPNLYRNISLIMYLEDKNNFEKMLKKNTWNL